MYEYRATIVRWIDGDTFEATVDLGFKTFQRTTFRLAFVDAPERGQPGFDEATAFANQLCPPYANVVIRTFRPDKYGRWVADIALPTGTLSSRMMEAGLVRAYP